MRYWIDELDSGARGRNTMRNDFNATPECGRRVNAVVNAGCAP